MQTYLNNSQQKAIEKLSQLKVGALFMQMGTGKTRTALELVRSTPCDMVLWITPFNTKANLLAEITACGGLENLVIEGIESIQQSDRVYLQMLALMENKRVFVVCDESIKIKNSSAKRTKRLMHIASKSEYRLILNGTPLTKDLMDLYPQMQFLSPKILKMSEIEFKLRYCEVVTVKKSINGIRSKREFIDGYHNIEHLYSLISPYVYECNLELEVDTSYSEMHYVISDEEFEVYKAIKEEFLDNEKLMAMNNNIFLAMTQKMQHGYCTTQDKFMALEKVFSEYGKENCIVFCKFKKSQIEVAKRYEGVKVLSFAKHSFGLNLQSKFVTVFFDKTFDYGLVEQAKHRTYRIGQQQNCKFISLTGSVGLESMIESNIRKKKSLLSYFKEVGAEQITKEL